MASLGTLTETTAAARARLTVSSRGQVVTFQITQTNASSTTEIYAIEIDEQYLDLHEGGVS